MMVSAGTPFVWPTVRPSTPSMSIAMESFTSERTGNLAIWRRTSSSYSALPVGGLAITTRRGGAILLTKDARLERVLNENTGLSSERVSGLPHSGQEKSPPPPVHDENRS